MENATTEIKMFRLEIVKKKMKTQTKEIFDKVTTLHLLQTASMQYGLSDDS